MNLIPYLVSDIETGWSIEKNEREAFELLVIRIYIEKTHAVLVKYFFIAQPPR